MEKCVDEGLVRSIGLSNFNSQQIQEVIDNSRIKPAVLQASIILAYCLIMTGILKQEIRHILANVAGFCFFTRFS